MSVKCPKCQTENPDTQKFCGECTTLLQTTESDIATQPMEIPFQELTTGSTFAGRYRIIEELGRGGMGKVYKALDLEIDEYVAIKLIKPEIAKDETNIQRFRNELKIARSVSHKHVCRMYDIGKADETYFISMEYVPGQDLKSLINKNREISENEVIRIAKQICEGLAEAHEQGIVHRDLKPQNIMMDEKGRAKITDFGLARSVEAPGVTQSGIIIGTPDYISPEQVDGESADNRSDIYSLGIILYEMVTGSVPFKGDGAFSVLLKHKTELPTDPRKLNPKISTDLSRLILICMEKDKTRRYQNAKAILDDLHNIEEGLPLGTKIQPRRETLVKSLIRRKVFFPALVAVIAIVAVIIWQLIPIKEAIPLAPEKPSIAVMYFENNTGDEDLNHLRKAIADLVITDLAQSQHLKILRGDNLFNILRELDLLEAKTYSSEDLKKVADRGRATHILQGNYTKAGESFRINYLLHEAQTEELIGSEMVEGSGEESIFSMVDDITLSIKDDFLLSAEEIAQDIDKDIGQITTNSSDALKYYIEGTEYQLKAENLNSIEFMEKAVAIDPQFAMAYRRMAVAYSNLGYLSEKMKYLQKALEFSDRVSDRERYQIQGDFYSNSEKTYDKAIEAYTRLLQLYPDDLSGNNNLGWLYSLIEEWDKSIERFEYLRQNNDEHPLTYTNLAEMYRNKGLYEKAEEVIKEYIARFPDNVWVQDNLAMNYLIQQKYNLALAENEKATSINPDYRWTQLTKGIIYHSMDDWTRAENEYKKLLEYKAPPYQIIGRRFLGGLYISQGKFIEANEQLNLGIEVTKKIGEKQAESLFHIILGYLHLNSGDYEDAIEEFEEAGKGFEEAYDFRGYRFAIFCKGLAYIKMKSMPEVQKLAEELREMIENGMNQKEMRLYHHLTGQIELEKENYSQAIEYFEKAKSLMKKESDPRYDRQALFMEPLALAYHKAGDMDKAQAEYINITQLTTGRLFYGDIYSQSFYMLGKISEQIGWEGKAIENYEKFIELWKNADPGMGEVEDAKKRLSGLKQ